MQNTFSILKYQGGALFIKSWGIGAQLQIIGIYRSRLNPKAKLNCPSAL